MKSPGVASEDAKSSAGVQEGGKPADAGGDGDDAKKERKPGTFGPGYVNKDRHKTGGERVSLDCSLVCF